MRAHILQAPGEDAQTELREVPRPRPGPGEVLVENHFAALNWGDTQIRRGHYPNLSHLRFPLIMGEEFAGVVAEVGAEVAGVKPGDRVAASNLQRGGFAECAIAPAARAIKLADHIPLDQAAAFFVVARTAYHLLFSAFNLRAGHRVLVHPISGGVGLMVAQMAVQAGAKVIGTTYSPHKIQQALDLGAELVIDRSRSDFVQEVMAHTNGEGVDLVVDSLGGGTLWQSFDALALYGRVVNIGETQGWPEGAVRDLRDKLYERSTSFAGFELDACEGTAHWTQGTQYCLEGLAGGKLAAPIAKVFPFERCREMFAALESRKLSGKCLLRVKG